jgi:hypothetical protein
LQSNIKSVPIGWQFWCMAGVVVHEDEALIGCNQILNIVFLLAGICGAWQALLYLQIKL